MNTSNINTDRGTSLHEESHKTRAKKVAAKAVKILGVSTALLALNGCLLTSPYWNQQFSDHTAAIPLQAWTTERNKAVKFECAKAYHGGLYPFGGPVNWISVATINSQGQALNDPLGGKIYGAGLKTTLPANCWRQDPGNSVWYAAVRAKHVSGSRTISYQTFDKTGLECLGRENGKATSWFGWINKGCTKTYSGSSTTIPYVIFRATS